MKNRRRHITRTLSLVLVAVLTASATSLPSDAASTSAEEAAPNVSPADGGRATPPVWDGLPSAALRPEPALPEPVGWSFGNRFPRTSGTGRHAAGAFFWSDFVYDDRGAIGPSVPVRGYEVGGYGAYHYPEPAAHGNGADIFGAAVGVEADATVWRVDWNSLADPRLPVAAFTFDTDADPATGASAWPAGAGLRSPGIDHALVLSAAGARLVDVASGTSTVVPLTVDTAARSFIARVPVPILPADDGWTIRLAAGLANPVGDGFLALDPSHGALPGQPNAYNVAFRGYEDEPPGANPWLERGQAVALGSGADVSTFAVTIDWDRLRAAAEEPEPLVTGILTNRWYVSSIEFAEGITHRPRPSGEEATVYGNRVQPYAVYVPRSYSNTGPAAPLTWILHGAGSNHNAQLTINPRLLDGACEQRRSICVSPFGRGPHGGWVDEAELDFWEVWNRVALAFRLDPDRTVLGGYSMGGVGTFWIGQHHPDLFAALYIVMSSDGHDRPRPALYFDLLENLRWTPLYQMASPADEAVPLPVLLAEIDTLDRLGYRYVLDVHVLELHLTPALKDDYGDLIDYLKGVGTRTRNPGHLTYRWYPATVDRDHGLGPTGAWWVQDLAARDQGTFARVDAMSAGQPDPTVTPVRSTSIHPHGRPSPALRRRLSWLVGRPPPRRAHVTLRLENVAALTLDLLRAGIEPGEQTVIEVDTDGPVTLKLQGTGTTTSLDSGHHDLSFPSWSGS